MSIELTSTNFDALVINAEHPVLIDFWAEWCGPCKMVGPIVEELANDFKGRALIGKVNVDAQPEIAERFGIRNIPALLYLKNGQVVDKQIGAVPRSVLQQKLEQQLF